MKYALDPYVIPKNYKEKEWRYLSVKRIPSLSGTFQVEGTYIWQKILIESSFLELTCDNMSCFTVCEHLWVLYVASVKMNHGQGIVVSESFILQGHSARTSA